MDELISEGHLREAHELLIKTWSAGTYDKAGSVDAFFEKILNTLSSRMGLKQFLTYLDGSWGVIGCEKHHGTALFTVFVKDLLSGGEGDKAYRVLKKMVTNRKYKKWVDFHMMRESLISDGYSEENMLSTTALS